MIQATVDYLGRLDICVNNAGVETYTPLLEIEERDWDLVLNTDLKGAFFCTQAAARHMVEQGHGAASSTSRPFTRTCPSPVSRPMPAPRAGCAC